MEKIWLSLGVLVRILGFIMEFRPDFRFMSSPYTSLKALEEGKAYLNSGFSPYFEGSPVHSPPLILSLYTFLETHLFFAFLLCAERHCAYLIKTLTKSSSACLLFYLNPFSVILILNCSTSILNIWAGLIFVQLCFLQLTVQAAYALAWVWYLDPSLGIISSVWYFKNRSLQVYFWTVLFLIALKLFSDYIAGPGWLESCQFSVFFMYDVQPSFGLRWYLMLEMFKEYYLMYSVMIAVHTWVYIYPLFAILNKFQRYSGYGKIVELYFSIILAIVYINHPHPTFFEYFLVICFLIPHGEIVLEVKSAFFTVSSWVIGNCFAVVMWNVWIYRMGGNANFFYFQTIFCNVVAIGFVVALLYQIVESTNRCKIKQMCREVVVESLSKLVLK